jgi:Protein of unknown function (DUF3373)
MKRHLVVGLAALLLAAAPLQGQAAPGSTTAAPSHPAPPAASPASARPASTPPSAATPPSGAEDDADGDAEGDGAAEAPAAGEVKGLSPEEVAQKFEDQETRLRELEDIVENLERKNAVQRLGWSADYRITLSSFRYSGDSPLGERNPDGTPRQVTLRNLEQWTHRVRIAMQADPTPQLRFRARMVAFKRFGDTEFGPTLDAAQGRLPRDATARFDRFWIDWFPTDKLSFSLGRISSTDGSPAELRENLDRPAATISLGLVDSEYEGVAVAYQTGDIVLRAFYLAWQFQRPDDPFGVFPYLSRDSQPDRIYGSSFSYRPDHGKIPTFELSAYINPAFRAVYPLDLPFNGAVIKPAKLEKSYGALGAASALLLWRDLAKGFDLFLSGSMSYSNSNGKTISYPIGPDGALVPLLTLVGGDVDNHLAYHAYAGFRLEAPFWAARAPRLGVEVSYGSRYLLTFSTPTTDLVSRLGIRGKTYDVYVIQPIYANLFARLSATFFDYDYAPALGGGFGFVGTAGGTAPKSDRSLRALNLMINASF